MRITAVLLLFTVAVTASADVHVQLRLTRSSPQAKPLGGTHAIWAGQGKLAMRDHDGTTQLFDLGKGIRRIIDARAKAYTEATFAQLRAARKKEVADRAAMLAQLQKALKDPKLDEAARSGLQKRLASLKTPLVVDAGAKVKIAGHECTHYSVKLAGRTFMEVWAAPGLGGAAVDQAFATMMELTAPAGAADAFKKIKGVWLRWRTTTPLPGGKSYTDDVVATQVSTAATGDKPFAIPSGFRKR